MFLKAVYRHSKLLCVVILFFFLLQLAVDFKRGMVFAPFFHYGMYSKPQYLTDTFTAWLAMDGIDTLKGHQFSPAHWDKLTYVPGRMEQWNCRKTFFDNEVRRLFAKAGIDRLNTDVLIQKRRTESASEEYTKRLKKYFKFKDSLSIKKQSFVWKNNKLSPVSQASTIADTCR